MSVIGVVKIAGSIACSMGAGHVAKNIIVATTPENLTKVTKGLVWVGRNVIVLMAGAAASNYFGQEFDSIGAGVKKFMGSKAQDESRETK